MKYGNAEKLLPKELLRSIQEYTQGCYLYIPIREENKKSWGECTDSRRVMRKRNEAIVEAHRAGAAVKALALRYHLTEHSIRRIIRESRNVQL
ncbi:CD3324 family protein [Brevibacillus brevis]|uniref:CD3324 family protein n=1 Tax=Brevibacillus brevis TaxID=1393 RepID=A0ABY9SZQ4_BREBE|nr:CD3324 family protein [Brevibacillus brevis]WNC13310.1 CD3324 family protein [Brevibacillus brevis]